MTTDTLLPCPLCGVSGAGYELWAQSHCFRWWNLMCGACSGLVAECLVGGVPKLDAPIAHWLSADEAWNAAAAYAEKMRIGYVRYEKLRKLSAGRFAELYELNLKGKGLFDDLVDKI